MKELVCIVCPRGCRLKVDEENDFAVTGNTCPRGAEYGRNEIMAPTRVLTSTVRLAGASLRRCPVKTDRPVPREKLLEIMSLLNDVELTSPVTIGQKVITNVCNTGANIIVTRNL